MCSESVIQNYLAAKWMPILASCIFYFKSSDIFNLLPTFLDYCVIVTKCCLAIHQNLPRLKKGVPWSVVYANKYALTWKKVIQYITNQSVVLS
jgi:hypothetical protein